MCGLPAVTGILLFLPVGMPHTSSLSSTLALLLLPSFAVKTPLMALHLWLPAAHAAAPTAGSLLLSGALLKLGPLGILRFCTLTPHAAAAWTLLSLLGAIVASLATLRQVDIKKVVAYSSVAHMSAIGVLVFSLAHHAHGAALLAMMGHGLVSPALFMLVAALHDRAHTKLVPPLAGQARTKPLLAMLLMTATLANSALPLSPGFPAEFLSVCALLEVDHPIALGLPLFAVICAAYGLWAFARVVHGRPSVNKLRC